MHTQERAAELEDFKSKINLTAFMADRGYELDEKASSRNSAVMIHGDGDKLIVGRGTDGHWIYCSVRDAADHGSIIDFEQRRGGGSLGDIRKRLRPLVGVPPAPAKRYARELQPLARDLVQVRAQLQGMYPLELCRRYLEEKRKIPGHVIDAPRFAGRILSDRRRNAVFPHWNKEGICGYELKNFDFTGFAPGGRKGLWCSRTDAQDEKFIVAETSIDALSYAALFGYERSRFVSMAGQFNPEQPDLIVGAARKLQELDPADCLPTSTSSKEIVLAFDNDTAGHEMAESITALLVVSAAGMPVRFHHPDKRGDDWNQVLSGR